VRLLVENRVGGKTILSQQLGNESIKYFFTEDTVFISTNEEYSTKMRYSINDSILLIGNFLKYKIDSLTDQTLTVTNIPTKDHDIDKLSTFTFPNIDYLFDYLKQTHQLVTIGDSLILAGNLLSPTHYGDITKLFLSEFASLTTDKTFTGSFIISKDGNIMDIQIPLSEKVLKKDAEKISTVIMSTKGSWIFPPTSKPFNYKINFSVKITRIEPLIAVSFTFHPKNKERRKMTFRIKIFGETKP
jgi:hypothetical protein